LTLLLSASNAIDRFSLVVGKYVSWLALLMVLVQFAIVVGRYVFGLGSIPLQESVIYSHAFLFLLGAAYTLHRGGHVRIDIFYAKASPKLKAIIDLMGSLFLLIPVCIAIFLLSWSYVWGAWAISESSWESSGLPFLYALKTIILVFCAMMFLQGISIVLKSLLTLSGSLLPLNHSSGEDINL
jgi:TRAP-type mannitol/chloroaromatic compound transport system permease small subunit